MGRRVVHHYPVGPWGNAIINTVPGGTVIRGAALRLDRATARNLPAIYVEKPVEPNPVLANITVEAFFVGTGHEFDPDGFDYIDTLEDGPFIWHVYARIV